jgi:hypothetical protein
MKKILPVLVALLVATTLLVSVTNAQAKKGENVITAGLGLGYPGVYGTSGMPPIFVTFDHAIIPNVSVGGVVSYSTSKYEWTGVSDYKWSYTYIFIGARGAYHFADQIKDLKNTDLYGGLTLGYSIVGSKFDGKDERAYPYSAGGGWFGFGIFIGGRYYFSPKFAATAELGYDIGFFKIGVSYKL